MGGGHAGQQYGTAADSPPTGVGPVHGSGASDGGDNGAILSSGRAQGSARSPVSFTKAEESSARTTTTVTVPLPTLPVPIITPPVSVGGVSSASARAARARD